MGWRSIAMSTSMCVCVCLSVREHISITTCGIFTNVRVACDRSSVLILRQGDEIRRERAILGSCPAIKRQSSLQPSLPRSLKRDHSIANNVKQQKGSFSMPGKCK